MPERSSYLLSQRLLTAMSLLVEEKGQHERQPENAILSPSAARRGLVDLPRQVSQVCMKIPGGTRLKFCPFPSHAPQF